eukprot:TRINITY_DN12870_c0_g1_i1.p1 TRINITY_DN12870_c0_g1~~TRINITY_DN12870_c0_g1_i1.p1  ORF type:complete len:306 (-),score=64.34 TRINITY_DN12870_c0_g1_i1:50-886(-)
MAGYGSYGGGGGFNAGTGATGGGYMADTNSQSPAKRNKSLTQTLTPLTVRQALLSEQLNDEWKVDGKELGHVTMVGMVGQLQETSTNINFSLDDGTGKISVKYWSDGTTRGVALREGIYLRIFGSIKSWKGEKQVGAFRYTRIEDYNEITFHLLECIQVHLQHTQPKLKAASAAGYQAPTAQAAAAPVAHTPYGHQPAANVYSTFGGGANSGFTPVQRAVISAIKELGVSETGAPFHQIVSKLKPTCAELEVKQALEFLSSEGHVYTTTDELHFKTTD